MTKPISKSVAGNAAIAVHKIEVLETPNEGGTYTRTASGALQRRGDSSREDRPENHPESKLAGKTAGKAKPKAKPVAKPRANEPAVKTIEAPKPAAAKSAE